MQESADGTADREIAQVMTFAQKEEMILVPDDFGALQMPQNEVPNFRMKYLDSAPALEPQADEETKERSVSHEQTLIWALRKELAAKTKLVQEMRAAKETLVDEVTALKVENARLTREASTGDLQAKLHSIFELKLEDAVEEERKRMHAEFTAQLEDHVQVIKEQSDQVISLRTNEVEL